MVTIRDAKLKDIPRLTRLNSQVQNWHVRNYPEYFNAITDAISLEPFWAEMIASSNRLVLLAETDSRIVGYALVERQSREKNIYMKAINRLYLHQIHVEKQTRRRGIARALLREIEDQADGTSEIALDTWQLNPKAHAFFQAQGFDIQRLLLSRKLAEPSC